MEKQDTICLLNDSFPPLIDGVANTVMNYAIALKTMDLDPIVVTPAYREANDQAFDYPIVRYPSIPTQIFEGYPAGIPFSPEVAARIKERNIRILHSHCPFMSTYMARQLRQITDAPIVFTYHTKFAIDIAHVTSHRSLQLACQKILVSNISSCDEIWAVSHGAGEDLRSLGYQGEYIVMPNGVDMPLGKVSDAQVAAATKGYDLPAGVPVYLFVGRMMWYKGLRIILDALAKLKAQGHTFRMVFVGKGDDYQQIVAYAGQCGIADRCIFTGPLYDREMLRSWYSRANLFLFPSTYDTNGLVVREAAASSTPAVLVKGSCASEGVTDGRNGFLIEENPDSLAACLGRLSVQNMAAVGENAAKELYLSWESAVQAAVSRYEVVIERQKSGLYQRPLKPTEGLMRINGELMDVLSTLSKYRHNQ